MEGPKNQSKLTRTQSSFSRSSPTIRSSIPSLSALRDGEAALDEEKPHKSILGASNRFPNFFIPILGRGLLSFSFFLFLYFYLRREGKPDSEDLLLALLFIAVALYFGGGNKGFIIRTALFLKQSWDEKNKKLGNSKGRNRSVEWFIGNEGSSSFKKQKITKEDVEFYSNGDFYEGEFHRGKCNGSGVYYYFVNGRYEGDWIDGRYEGYGIESWGRGSRYLGQYRLGLRHGYGVYRFYTGDSYAGEWFNGQSNGMGVQTCSDGSCYVGEFKFGVKHGHGCYHFRNGDTYAGEYFGDKIHGFGVYHFANGHCYEGSWHEGYKQGFGMYSFQNRDARCGELDSGVLKTPLALYSDSVLRSVQLARKAAERASQLPPVDDLVKKAVIAANRAATAARVAAIKAVQNRMDRKFYDMDV